MDKTHRVKKSERKNSISASYAYFEDPNSACQYAKTKSLMSWEKLFLEEKIGDEWSFLCRLR